ncbi:MAG: diguanylate cyclase [Ruminiclostridium sp.]|nr:diguanylate cyclase [Ruminiclostridium sp.]
MTDLKINVYVQLGADNAMKALEAVHAPHHVTLCFPEHCGSSADDFPDDRAHVVITDSTGTADTLAALALSRLHIVFVGKAALTDKLEDVWNTDDAAEIAARLERLLARLADGFFADFYKKALFTTIDTVPDMLWFKRLDGIHTMVNTAFTEVVHKTREDIICKDHFYIWDAPRPAEGNEFACAESEETAISTGRMYVCDEPVKTREGMKQLTTYKTPVYDMFGNVFGTVGVAHDVTNFSNLGIELSILVENLPFPMIIFTADMKIVRMNESFMSVAEICPEFIDSFDYEEWKARSLVPVDEKVRDERLHLTTQEFEAHRNNEVKHYIVRMQEIHDFFDNISGYFLIIEDITYRRAYEESILKAANTDMLTGMYNRRYFYNYLSDNSDEPMTLFYMDLDRFKYINDRYGHAKGDEVLIKTAKVIKTRFPNAVSARLGGDEFALIFDGVLSEKDKQDYSTNLESTIQRIFTADGLPVTMSVGVVVYEVGTDIDELMHIGDRRMYEVKKRHHDEDYE